MSAPANSSCRDCGVSWPRKLSVCPRCGKEVTQEAVSNGRMLAETVVWIASESHSDAPYRVVLNADIEGCVHLEKHTVEVDAGE